MRQLLVITFGVCETLRGRLVIAMPLFDVVVAVVVAAVVVVADVAALRLKRDYKVILDDMKSNKTQKKTHKTTSNDIIFLNLNRDY